MRFEFPKQHRDGFGPIRKACELTKVSKSGYYEYAHRRKPNAQIEREALEGFVKEAFERHRARYGYRRINRELRKTGVFAGEKRVLHVMRRLGLVAKGATRKHGGPKGGRGGRPQAQHRGAGVCRRPKEQALDGRHHVHPDQGGMALPRYRHRRVLQEGGRLADVGSHHREARDRRDRASHRAQGSPNDGSLVFHDDQGIQRTSKAFQRRLGPHGAAQSISRPGTPLDNAVAESFFKTLEGELVKGRDYGTREEARQDIFKYIEPYCDTVRMHSSLGYVSPMEYERRRA